MLGQEQVRVAEGLPRDVERGMKLAGAGGDADKAPVVAMTLHSCVLPSPPCTQDGH